MVGSGLPKDANYRADCENDTRSRQSMRRWNQCYRDMICREQIDAGREAGCWFRWTELAEAPGANEWGGLRHWWPLEQHWDREQGSSRNVLRKWGSRPNARTGQIGSMKPQKLRASQPGGHACHSSAPLLLRFQDFLARVLGAPLPMLPPSGGCKSHPQTWSPRLHGSQDGNVAVAPARRARSQDAALRPCGNSLGLDLLSLGRFQPVSMCNRMRHCERLLRPVTARTAGAYRWRNWM